MTNIVCLLYVGWITNYVANGGPKVAESGGEAERKLEEDSKGETLRIIERLDRLESVVNEHIKGQPGVVYFRSKFEVNGSVRLSAAWVHYKESAKHLHFRFNWGRPSAFSSGIDWKLL